MIWLLFGYGCTQTYRTMHCLMVLLRVLLFQQSLGCGNSHWVLLPTAEVVQLSL